MKDFREIESRSKMHLIFLLITGLFVIFLINCSMDQNVKRLFVAGLALFFGFSVFQLSRSISYLYNNLIIDELTKVYNYRYFITRLEEEMDRANRYGRSLVLAIPM